MAGHGTTRTARLLHEIKASLIAFAYLYACIGAITFHEQALLEGRHLHEALFVTALAKALVLAKFLTIGEATGLAGGLHGRPLLHRLLYRTLAFLALILVLDAIDEVVMGMIHGETLAAAVAGIGGGSALRIVSGALLLWLILQPYFLFKLVDAELGHGTLRRMLLERREAAAHRAVSHGTGAAAHHD
jgi:hypothetical protein